MLHKKLYLGLAPILAVAAFMVVPAMASAAEWEVNGKNEGATHIAVATYGELKLHDVTLEQTIVCDVVDKGHVWNEGGVGHDEITLFDNENCVVEGTGGAVTCTVVLPNLPYTSVLEEVGGVVRDKIAKAGGEIEVEVKCPAAGLEATYKGASLTPKVVNGTPSFAEFDGEPSGVLISGIPSEAIVEGDDYIVGFKNETITVK